MPSGTSATVERLTKRFVSVEARKALQRTYDVKRKASEVQENLSTHRERTRRISNEHARAEAHVNDGVGSLGQAVRASAKATHSLTCGVPDREGNEVTYLREATELIEGWHIQLQGGQAMSGPPCEHSEVSFSRKTKVKHLCLLLSCAGMFS